MNRTCSAVTRSRWTARAGRWAALSIALAYGIAAPAAGTMLTSGQTLTVGTSAASGGTLGNGWGG
jgi:hypothetical protein